MVKLVMIVFAILPICWGAVFASEIEEGKKIFERVNEQAKVTQKKVDELADKTDAITGEYLQVLSKISSIDKYNNQLQVLIESQLGEINSLEEQLGGLEGTHRDIYPLMQNMISSLETFVELDVPFLPEERENRISSLQAMLKRADTNVSEKYRRVLEAYMIEVDYGRTIEAYEQTLEVGGATLNVDMLRIGRIALLYKSRDDSRLGFWNSQQGSWQDLESDFLRYIRKGLKIARKQCARFNNCTCVGGRCG